MAIFSSHYLLADAPKSQCSSLSDGESFEGFGESEPTENKKYGNTAGGGIEGVPVADNMSRLSSQSMMGGGGGNGVNQQLSPLTSDSSSGDPELSINSSNGNNG